MNGDAPAPIASVSGGAEAVIPPKTTTEKIARRNDLKAKSTLLLAIPNEHLLKFHGIKDAKTLWEAIKTNVAFVTSDNTSSTNEAVNTAHDVSPASSHGQTFASTYANDVMFSFFANQSNSLQLDNKDLEQIDTDDLKEMDLKWQVECYNCHMRGHFARECRAPRSQGNRNGDNTRRVVPVETPSNALVVTDGLDKTGLGYDSPLNERDLSKKSDVFESTSGSSVNESEEDNIQANNRKICVKNEGKATSQREVRPLWKNAKRVNHQNFSNNLTHPHPKRNFVLTTVITNSRKVPVNAAKQSSPRVATTTSTARYVNTAANRPTMTAIKPSSNVFHKLHSPVRRTFNQRITPKNSDLKETVYTVKETNPSLLVIKRLMEDLLHLEEVLKEKGKQHKASCKPKLVSSISQPLQMLHRDLFGLTFVKSLNNKMYCLVVTDNFSRRVEENLHIKFLEKKPNIAGRGPEWLFDIDSLTYYKNYEPVTAGNQTNNDACIKINANAGKAKQENASDHEYTLLPFMPLRTQNLDDKDVGDVPDKGDKGISKGSVIDDQEKIDSSTQNVGTAEPSINTTSTNVNTGSLNINIVCPNDLGMPSLEETGIFDDVYDVREVGEEADINNLELLIVVSPIPTIRVQKNHPKEQIIGDLKLATQTRRMLIFSKENVMKFDFTTVKTASTPMKPNKTLIKDAEAKDVDVHLNRSMIGSWMYLKASRPDIMFVVCACARTLYLIHSLMANLEFYEKHNMVAFLKKPTGSEGFQEIVDFMNGSHIRAVDNGEQQIIATVDGTEFTITEASVRRHLQLADADREQTPLFPTLLGIQAEEGKGSGPPSEPQPPSSSAQPIHKEQLPTIISSTHQKTQTSRQALDENTKLPQTSVPIPNVPDEVVYEKWQSQASRNYEGSIAQTRSERVPTPPHDSPLLRFNTIGRDEGNLRQTKKVYGTAYTKLIMKERMIEDIDQDTGITLVAPTKISSQKDQPEDQLGVLSAVKVLADAAKKKVNNYTRRRRAVSTGSKGISTASRIFSTAKELVSTTSESMPISTADVVQKGVKDKAQKLYDEEHERFNAEQEEKFNAEKEELLASETTKDEDNPSVTNVD
uniref:CCHC-type domain-containing protein n=1 Tax=Tanacetum cinerariifolium TaxID=118510 RepID=A0A699GGV3_TANCI|nr:hypothetical protein [Tanacetum cinerariifolium]